MSIIERNITAELSLHDQVRALTRIVVMQGQRIAELERRASWERREVAIDVPKCQATMQQIAEAHAVAWRVTVEAMQAKSRSHGVSIPRQLAMADMHEAGFSTPVIGRFFNRDHTTVLHGIKAAKARAA